ncbi:MULTISPECIES: hypothetical protein [unclassified Sphingobium]|uniref:hypothetical protein n=1 Tax=unclassified Sphingobium TaxID=2611147 RepID=UPI000D162378|nr:MULTISPECIES: hypothetical protein [unclassified Sphingobium]PSO09712.1 hypothetical protein C7E20_21030 [Sphingobium sp. AEW4]TWD19034.1 hypothetical protein FB596_12222 [Sphingobium sp. AEW013]
MGVLIVSTIFVLVICLLAYRADARFQNEARLPMQWGFTGQVNWSAPRRLALAFMPVLAFALLGFFAFMSINVPPRAGQEGLVFPILVVMGGSLVGAQLFHFWLIERTIRRNVD